MKKEPTAIIQGVATVVTVVAALLAQIIAEIPADANWLIAGIVVVKVVAAFFNRQSVYSPASYEAKGGNNG